MNILRLLTIIFLCGFMNVCAELSLEMRAQGFVYLHEIDPTIQVSLRYAGNENFVGAPVDGYTTNSVVIITAAAAHALRNAQQSFMADGYCLVVYDAYRPQKAVNNFMNWSVQLNDQTKKSHYYPRINKADVFDLRYVARRSGHTRGSTVDLTIIEQGKTLHDVVTTQRVLSDGSSIMFLDDGTVDMGSSFDLLDEASSTESILVGREFQQRRNYLKLVMERHGFKISPREWWHFTLNHEPFPFDQVSSYFDADIE